MIGTTNKVPTARGLSTLTRPRFGPGMLLQHDDLDLLADYTRDLNRLLFRSLFGCGVVCGLEVKHAEECGKDTITVDGGLGLLCSGDPVYVPRQQTVVIDEECAGITETKLWVVLCRTTKACSPRPSMCASDDDEMASSATRERDGFEIRVLADPPKCACFCELPKDEGEGKEGEEAPADACGCVDPTDPCYLDHYNGVCGCECTDGDGCCDCIILALLNKDGESWKPDHRVRRFVRPVLMRDPVALREATDRKGPGSGTGTGSGGGAVKAGQGGGSKKRKTNP